MSDLLQLDLLLAPIALVAGLLVGFKLFPRSFL